jgi:hypothetical protein
MNRILFLAFVLFASLTVFSQHGVVDPNDPAFITKYASFDFQGKFSSAIDKDAANNYFLVDFSRLPSRFERVYFMDLSFSANEIVNIDPVITKDRVCFSANKKYSEDEVLKIFGELEKNVKSASSAWSEDKKSAWLQRNDKYK